MIMIHQQIKELFFSSVEHIVSDISQYAVHPDSDFKRSKKNPAQKLISFLVSQGSSSTRVEMLDFWGLDSSIPTASALSQQRAKLKPDALEAVFRHFNSTSMEFAARFLYGFALPFPGCRWLYLHFFQHSGFLITRLLLLPGTMFWME